MTPRKTAILFLTHRAEPDVFERFTALATQTRGHAQAMVLLDGATPGIEKAWRYALGRGGLADVPVWVFRARRVARELSVQLLTPLGIVPGSAHLPLIWVSRRLSHDVYWLLEDDVHYTGDWGDFLRRFESDDSDLLCSHVIAPQDVPHWPFWDTLKAPAALPGKVDPFSVTRKGFLPVYRVSAAALDTILAYQQAGWSGHFEGLLPTIINVAGLTLGDLNAAAGLSVYTPGVIFAGEGTGPLSSLRYRPFITPAELAEPQPDLIYHPVKGEPPRKRSLPARVRRRLLRMHAEWTQSWARTSGAGRTILPDGWLAQSRRGS